MSAGCPFITCAVKKKGIEFCWECAESATCARWHRHREFGKTHDTFVCYQTIDDTVAFVQRHGIAALVAMHDARERWLRRVLEAFNEGRSKRYYCVAATVLALEELEMALSQAERDSAGLSITEKSKVLHTILDGIAEKGGYCLRLRK